MLIERPVGWVGRRLVFISTEIRQTAQILLRVSSSNLLHKMAKLTTGKVEGITLVLSSGSEMR